MNNSHLLSADEIKEKARSIRKKIIEMNSYAGAGHTGADLSETDILAVLYFHVLGVNSTHIDTPDRDRFVLSKGHGVGGLYCTLSEAGFFDQSWLQTYLQAGSRLPGHPVRQKTPGVEFNTGALGHGLPAAFGLALSAKIQKLSWKTYVLLGDGELGEGSNWEAAMAAAHYKLDNLIVILDRNTLQLADRTESIMQLEPLQKKWEAFGFEVHCTNGNDPEELLNTFHSLQADNERPKLVLARTIKGKGVSFIEDKAAWHHRIPVGDEVFTAIKELE